MAWVDKIIIMISDLGKGLVKNPVTNLIDINLSINPNNILKFDTDNSLIATETASAEDIQNLTKTKQDTLVSGVNIKKINGESLLGNGNLIIGGGTPLSSFPMFIQKDRPLTLNSGGIWYQIDNNNNVIDVIINDGV
jgi:hypothetical protein